MSNVKPIPEGYHAVTPGLVVSDGNAAIEFYTKAFGAVERSRAPGSDGRLLHAEIQIAGSVVMLSDAFPEHGGSGAPQPDAKLPMSLHLFVEDADAAFARATEAGCTVTMPLMDAFWGDRYGRVRDPFGHTWAIATRKEELSPEQMETRQKEAMKAFGK